MLKKVLMGAMCFVLAFSVCSCSEKKQPEQGNDTKPATENTTEVKGDSSFSSIDTGSIDIKPVEPVKVKDVEMDVDIEWDDIDLSVDSVDVNETSAFKKLSDEEKIELKKQYALVIQDIKFGFEAADFKININDKTGEVAVDASVLFDTDKYEVTSAGKSHLEEFLKAYVPVITKHSDFISYVQVEGHTDTDGDYDYNKKLSQKRADSVLTFCKSSDAGLGSGDLATVKSKFKAVGYSYDRPVYGSDGKVDMAASRRVTFRFFINID